MPFKIVQTREKGNILLSIVPDQWEFDRTLRWPQSGKLKPSVFNALIRDETSVPGDDWLKVKCRLKRQCATYDEAVFNVKPMYNRSDTDTDISLPPPPHADLPVKRKIVDRLTIGRTNATDFTDVVSVIFIFRVWNSFNFGFCSLPVRTIEC